MLAAPAYAQIGVDVGGSAGANVEAGASGAGADIGVDTNAEAGADAGSSTSMPGTGAEIDTGTTAAIDATFDSALSAISGNSGSATAIEGMSEVDSVNVVRIDELQGHDEASLDEAVTQNETAIEELRSSIEANASLSQELETEGVSASDVVAAQVEADGKVTVYVM